MVSTEETVRVVGISGSLRKAHRQRAMARSPGHSLCARLLVMSPRASMCWQRVAVFDSKCSAMRASWISRPRGLCGSSPHQVFTQHHLVRSSVYQVSDIETQLHFVAHGLGVAIVPSALARSATASPFNYLLTGQCIHRPIRLFARLLPTSAFFVTNPA